MSDVRYVSQLTVAELASMLLATVQPPPVPVRFDIPREAPIPKLKPPDPRELTDKERSDVLYLFDRYGTQAFPESADDLETEVGCAYHEKFLERDQLVRQQTQRHEIMRMAHWHITYAKALAKAAKEIEGLPPILQKPEIQTP